MNSSLEPHLWAVILAGGIGSRFWPASTPARPKQLLQLASEKPLIRETVDRIEPLVPTKRLRILTGEQLTRPIGTSLSDFTSDNYFVEPRAAGTAPVLVWAAAQIAQVDPDAVMISLHADHVIDPPELFREQLLEAAELAARHGLLFTLGATPTRPETGYGYIQPGSPLRDGGDETPARYVEKFVEKPDADRAADYVTRGYLWNTGIFIWRVRDLLEQIVEHTPEIGELIPLLDEGRTDEYFARVPNLSIDEGLLERSERIGVLPARFQWDDIGAWDALYRTQTLDSEGNAKVGDAHAVDSKGCALYAEDGPVVAFGVEDLVVVRTAGVTFVMDRHRAAELKTLLSKLPDRLRTLE